MLEDISIRATVRVKVSVVKAQTWSLVELLW